MPDELQTEVHDIVQETGIKTIPKKKKCKKSKWLSDKALQIAEERREAKAKGEKGKYPFECRVPKHSKPLWERERVGRFGRMTLKHVKYHVRNELPVQVRCTILDAWG